MKKIELVEKDRTVAKQAHTGIVEIGRKGKIVGVAQAFLVKVEDDLPPQAYWSYHYGENSQTTTGMILGAIEILKAAIVHQELEVESVEDKPDK